MAASSFFSASAPNMAAFAAATSETDVSSFMSWSFRISWEESFPVTHTAVTLAPSRFAICTPWQTPNLHFPNPSVGNKMFLYMRPP